MTEKKMITATEVMERLSISYPSVLRKVKAKEIAYVKLGNKLLFPISWFNNLEKQAYANFHQGTNKGEICE